MISGFDHAPVIVRDLDAAVARCSALFGRAPSWIGRLDGARHAWFQLANIAIEVIAADGDGATGDNIRLWLEDRAEGPSALGFATPAFDEARRMLDRRGVPMAAPEEARSVGDDGRERTWRYAMADSAATRGVLSAVYLKDPSDPRWARDRGMQLYRHVMATYARRADAGDLFYLYGMGAAFTMVDVLRKAGRAPTRAKVMDLATHLFELNNPALIPGIAVRTSPSNRFPVRAQQLARYENGTWRPFGPIVDASR